MLSLAALLFYCDVMAKGQQFTPNISTGIVYSSRTDSARYMAANLVWPESLSAEATLGLPIGKEQSWAGLGAVTYSYREWLGLGGAMEWYNPGLGWRGGAGFRVPWLKVPGITLGATLINPES
ncbi:MAG: hypothetical protein AAB425_11890, partial [Bdellovibrionota bacterium]